MVSFRSLYMAAGLVLGLASQASAQTFPLSFSREKAGTLDERIVLYSDVDDDKDPEKVFFKVAPTLQYEKSQGAKKPPKGFTKVNAGSSFPAKNGVKVNILMKSGKRYASFVKNGNPSPEGMLVSLEPMVDEKKKNVYNFVVGDELIRYDASRKDFSSHALGDVKVDHEKYKVELRPLDSMNEVGVSGQDAVVQRPERASDVMPPISAEKKGIDYRCLFADLVDGKADPAKAVGNCYQKDSKPAEAGKAEPVPKPAGKTLEAVLVTDSKDCPVSADAQKAFGVVKPYFERRFTDAYEIFAYAHPSVRKREGVLQVRTAVRPGAYISTDVQSVRIDGFVGGAENGLLNSAIARRMYFDAQDAAVKVVKDGCFEMKVQVYKNE